jgi:hypothetical protein
MNKGLSLIKYRNFPKIRSFYLIHKKNITGYYFTSQPNTRTIKNENSVPIYQAPEWNEIQSYLNERNYFNILPNNPKNIELLYGLWEDCVMATKFKAKYFALLPFAVEDRQTARAKKKFVLNMELYPTTKQLKLTLAMISGI